MLNPASFFLIDIGADGGIHPRWEKIPNLHSILFEPNELGYETLRKNAPPKSTIIPTAISERTEKRPFYYCRSPSVSSLLKPNLKLLTKFRDTSDFQIEKQVLLKTQSLDEALSDQHIPDADFLKIDAQGVTYPILRGAEKTLEKLIGLEVEVSFIEVYEGEILFEEVHRYLKQKGFELYNLRRCFWKRRNGSSHSNGQLAFADALYFKSPEFLHQNGLPSAKMKKASLAYSAYHQRDLMNILDPCQKNSSLWTLPDFRGKGRIRNFLLKLARRFEPNQKQSSLDSTLCNQIYE